MRFRVLQHVSFETAGWLAERIGKKGHSLQVTALYAGEALPATAEFDVLMVMGGPMSIHDEAEYPWLIAEKRLIAAAIGEGKKVLGICLGAQLIAAVRGAKVYRNPVKEIGFWPVRWAGDRITTVFHWHGETFDLPEGATLLASTEGCVNQAFSLGDKVLAIQFHPEVTGGIIRAMIENEGWELDAAGKEPYVQPAGQILARHADGRDETSEWLAAWLDGEPIVTSPE
jgi:GMP synthase-like glutamine amidotransferase